WTRNKYGLEVHVSADPLANSPRKDVRTLLFESVRELLLNVVKHARVDRVTVDLRAAPDDELSICVADQGIGFDPARLTAGATAATVGWGRSGSREGLTLLGGRFTTDSARGRGRRFHLFAPRGTLHEPVSGQGPMSHGPFTAVARAAASQTPEHALRILVV